ncbi:diaminopimelate epimerase [Corynebacterium alimapuense]|uniref:Diaminopimelate epimerase n=1 Tax=Corynebacterium alimapuense TaxID=1576874 RepID=A0A3M8K976_9CORY|nr:diaminopimelate epimerase [Corynebacterium alimapuense]RNE49335.1 diaminopimelate epimerase [Corynebacterium alimapuense]
MNTIEFSKGHGTENDFIILPDPHGQLDLTPAQVTALCDRRAGLGADGILHVVFADGLWFMDYRNADGSIAEMCGNGVRVFAHYLRSRGLVDTDAFTVNTRAGQRPVVVHDCDDFSATVTVEMGPAEVTGVSTAQMGGLDFAGLGVDLGNPHLAAVIPGLSPQQLSELVFDSPTYDAEFFPEGVNLEVVTELVDDRVSMRVFERGVGETRSCGTGIIAAARAALADAGKTDGQLTVEVPGGQVLAEITGETSRLTGPSRIIASGQIVLAD